MSARVVGGASVDVNLRSVLAFSVKQLHFCDKLRSVKSARYVQLELFFAISAVGKKLQLVVRLVENGRQMKLIFQISSAQSYVSVKKIINACPSEVKLAVYDEIFLESKFVSYCRAHGVDHARKLLQVRRGGLRFRKKRSYSLHEILFERHGLSRAVIEIGS